MTSDGNEAKFSWPQPNMAHQKPTGAPPEQWDQCTKLSAPLGDEFCTRTERSLYLNGFHKKKDLLEGGGSSGISLAPFPQHSPGSGFLGLSAEKKQSQGSKQRLPEPTGNLPPNPYGAPEAPPRGLGSLSSGWGGGGTREGLALSPLTSGGQESLGFVSLVFSDKTVKTYTCFLNRHSKILLH